MPTDGDTVFITNAGSVVTLSCTTSNLTAATVSRTLVFTNWTTRLRATTVTLKSGALLKLPGSFSDDQMSNRIHIACHDFTMEQGSTINADYGGYSKNAGPSKGANNSNYSAGAGHAGQGGSSSYAFGGMACGSLETPVLPGSGGGVRSSDVGETSSDGGGSIQIEATGAIAINGSISANGRAGTWSNGGGAGGSIYITCDTFAGQANGSLLVKGGNAGAAAYSGGGSGGRIAVLYTHATFTGGFRMDGTPGTGVGNEATGQFFFKAARGTVYLSDDAILSETLGNNLLTQVDLHIAGLTEWTVDRLSVNNCSVFLANDGLTVNVRGDVTIGAGGHLGVGRYCGDRVSRLLCGGNLYVTNSGALSVFAGLTNGVESYGAQVDVAGDMTVANKGWIYPYCHTNTGAAVRFTMDNLWIRRAVTGVTTQGFNASGKGFSYIRGPGAAPPASEYGAGGGFGGKGGDGLSQGKVITGGGTCGLLHAPQWPGSGGSGGVNSRRGGHGGGMVWIEAKEYMQCDGELNANGAPGQMWHSGGGSGGSIFMRCRKFVGDGYAGLLASGAKSGSATYAGGGGGGRIAVWYGQMMPVDQELKLLRGDPPGHAFQTTQYLGTFEGICAVDAGTGYTAKGTAAEPGTKVFLKYQPAATVLMLR